MEWLLDSSRVTLLNEEVFFHKIYESLHLQYSPALYQISSQFRMNSQHNALQSSERRVRKRKINACLRTEEDELVDDQQYQIRSLIRSSSFYRHAPENDNNREAKSASKKVTSIVAKFGAAMGIVPLSNGDYISIPVCSGFYNYSGEIVAQISSNAGEICENYLVPPRSSFIFGDATLANDLDEKFDLISMDPPWNNKSVKRKKMYNLNDSIFESLRLENILSDTGIVIIWITNRTGLVEVVDKQLENWGLKRVAIWTWLKITTAGEPVYPLDLAHHKKSYENFVIGSKVDRPDIAKNRLICSVPMAVHSHKPPAPMLAKCLNHAYARHLELFARNLLPDTLSIGHEPLLLQNKNLFDAFP